MIFPRYKNFKVSKAAVKWLKNPRFYDRLDKIFDVSFRSDSPERNIKWRMWDESTSIHLESETENIGGF